MTKKHRSGAAGFVERFDEVVTSCLSFRSRHTYKIFRLLGKVTVPVCWAAMLIGLFLWSPENPTPLYVLILLPLSGAIKVIVRRERPAGEYSRGLRTTSYSFPSSHAYSSVLAGGYIAGLFITNGMSLLALVTLGLVLVIGVSRVAIGAHYPSDVVGGWILGVAVWSAAYLV